MSNGKWWEGDEVHMDEGERVREAKTGKDGKINHKFSAYPFNKFESLQWPIPQIFRRLIGLYDISAAALSIILK